MSRYIDADALIDDLVWCKGQSAECNRDEWDGLIMRVLEQPTVDAVQVVRCEKCRHGIKNHGISDGWVLCSKPYVTDTVGNMMHRCDWFCADGERKDGEHERTD